MMNALLNPHVQFLDRGGEMGSLIKIKDWSKTALGPLDSWPQSLNTTLSIILHSKFPMFLWWGPELICFYNDAYRPSLGLHGKHPAILGMRAQEAWPEIWHMIKPLIEQVLAGGEATWMEDQLIPIFRNGKMEDVYWTFSYSAVNDESGQPAGVFVTCTETTEKVDNYKLLVESKNQFEFAIEAAELGTWDLDPATNRFTSNDRLREIFGLPPNREIELTTALDLIAEKDRARVTETILDAMKYSSGGKYDIDYTISNPTFVSQRIVRAKGKAWFNEEKICYRFNGTLQDITHESLAHKKIEESEQRLRNFIESAPFPIGIYMGKELRVEFANQAIIDVWHKGNDVIGKLISDILPELKDQNVLAKIENVFDTGIAARSNNQRVELVIDGNHEVFYFNSSYKPLFDALGKVYGVMNIAADVTELNLAIQKVKESEERFRTMAEGSEILIATSDETGHATYFNKAWENLTGRPAMDLLNFAWTDMMHSEDAERFITIYLKALERKEPFTGEIRLLDKNGNYRWLLAKGQARHHADGTFAGYISSSIDITDRKEGEEKIKLISERFRLLADSMPQFVWISDTKGNLNYYNKAVYDYSGLSYDDIEKGGWLQIVHPDDREENVREWIQAISTGNDFVFSHRFRRHDGEYRWQLSRAIPQKDATGNIQMWVGTSTDIQELKELDQQKDSFLSIASHELKTPLTTIKAYGQIVEKMLEQKGDIQSLAMIKKMSTQVSRFTTLIEDLLNITKIQKGKLQYNEDFFNFNELVNDSIDDMQKISLTHQIKNIGKINELIFGDKEKINQVLNNLISNAIKYSPSANEIVLNSTLLHGGVQLSVQDFGIGIPEKAQEHVFEQFYRVTGENQSTFPGLGIGLYIGKEIITRHGGRIWIDSIEGAGTTFYFWIPIDHREELKK